MKKRLCLLAALWLLVLSGAHANAEEPLTLQISPQVGSVGDVLVFPVTLSGNENLAGFQFRVDFDPSYLELVSASVTVPGGYRIVNKYGGSVECIWTSASPYTGNGAIAELSFRLLRQGSSRLYLLADSENGEGFYNYENGVFQNYAFNAPPARVTCKAPAPPGDVDLDGKIGISDATALLDVLAEGAASSGRLDLDGDGSVGIADVSALLDLLAA